MVVYKHTCSFPVQNFERDSIFARTAHVITQKTINNSPS